MIYIYKEGNNLKDSDSFILLCRLPWQVLEYNFSQVHTSSDLQIPTLFLLEKYIPPD